MSNKFVSEITDSRSRRVIQKSLSPMKGTVMRKGMRSRKKNNKLLLSYDRKTIHCETRIKLINKFK